jgi:hypothetical protein
MLPDGKFPGIKRDMAPVKRPGVQQRDDKGPVDSAEKIGRQCSFNIVNRLGDGVSPFAGYHVGTFVPGFYV